MDAAWIPLSFAVVAFIYSAAGLGGGSAYLAILALAGLSFDALPQVSLSCNLLVSGLAFFWYARSRYWRWKLALPFVVTSIPFSFVGGQLEVSETVFRILLSASLLLVALFFLARKKPFVVTRKLSAVQLWNWAPLCGAALGLLAGIVGIGGGIFLIPLLLISGLATPKEAASTGSFFILVNSVAGLAGRSFVQPFPFDTIWPLWLAVLIGGWLGGRSGAVRFSPVTVQRVFSAILVWASLKIVTGV